ncbi:MAG: sulfurtransferase TusA [Pseudomonadales bacterium]|nr:sulfurtransferase TusA [Pseudomonadales bacterium]
MTNPEHKLDARGLLCPEPVMLLHKSVRRMQEGEELEILATDPSTQRDIPKFCDFLGHTLIMQEVRDDVYIYRLRKGM